MIKMLLILVGLLFQSPTQTFRVTNYTNTVKQCGKTNGITASGYKIQKGFCAAHKRFPFGTIIKLDTGEYLIVADRGRLAKNQLDRAHLNGIHSYYPQVSRGRVVFMGHGKDSIKQAIIFRRRLINVSKQIHR